MPSGGVLVGGINRGRGVTCVQHQILRQHASIIEGYHTCIHVYVHKNSGVIHCLKRKWEGMRQYGAAQNGHLNIPCVQPN